MVYKLAGASTRWQENVDDLTCLLTSSESKEIAVDLSGILRSSCPFSPTNHFSLNPNTAKHEGDLRPLSLALLDADMLGDMESTQPTTLQPTTTHHHPFRPPHP